MLAVVPLTARGCPEWAVVVMATDAKKKRGGPMEGRCEFDLEGDSCDKFNAAR